MEVGCSLRFVWEDIRDDIIDRLSTTTFADLVARAGGPWRDPEPLQPV
jgi:DNA-binding IscR family transcriptional regulator